MKNALKQCNIAHIMSFGNGTAERIIDHLSTAILLLDGDLRLKCINAAGESMLSVSSNRVEGMTAKEIWPSSSYFNRAIGKSIETGATRIERSVDIDLNEARSIKVDCMITPILEEEFPTEILVELIDANAYERVINEENQTYRAY